MDDQKIRLLLDIVGAGDVRELNAAFREARQAFRETGEAAQVVEREVYDFADSYEVLGSRSSKLDAELRRVTQATQQATQADREGAAAANAGADAQARKGRETRGAGDAAVESSRKLNGLNGAVRNLGYGVADVFANNGPIGQKMMGFANNITGMITGVLQSVGKLTPATAAAAAGAEIAFTVVGSSLNAFGIKTFDDLVRLVTGATKAMGDRLEQLKDRIKELDNREIKLPVDVIELQNARREVEAIKGALAEVEKLRKSQQYYEKESGKAIGEVLEEESPGGAQAVYDKLRAQEAKRQEEASGPLREARAEAAKYAARARKIADEGLQEGDDAATFAARLDLARQQFEAAAEKARGVMVEITKDDGSADRAVGGVLKRAKQGAGGEQAAAQKQLAEMLKRAGFGDLADEIGASSPDVIRRGDEQDEEFDRSEAARKAGAGDRKAAAAAVKKKVDDFWKGMDHELAQQIAGDNADDRVETKEHREALAELRRAQQAEAHAFGKATDNVTHQAKADARVIGSGTTIDEQAAEYAARLRAQGGDVDRQGRFHAMDADRQQQAVAAAVRTRLPKSMAPERADPLAREIARGAGEDVDKRVMQRQAQVQQTNPALSGTQAQALATQQVVADLQGVVAQAMQQVQRIGMNNQRLMQQNRALQQQVRTTSESALNLGGPGG